MLRTIASPIWSIPCRRNGGSSSLRRRWRCRPSWETSHGGRRGSRLHERRDADPGRAFRRRRRRAAPRSAPPRRRRLHPWRRRIASARRCSPRRAITSSCRTISSAPDSRAPPLDDRPQLPALARDRRRWARFHRAPARRRCAPDRYRRDLARRRARRDARGRRPARRGARRLSASCPRRCRRRRAGCRRRSSCTAPGMRSCRSRTRMRSKRCCSACASRTRCMSTGPGARISRRHPVRRRPAHGGVPEPPSRARRGGAGAGSGAERGGLAEAARAMAW